MIERDLTAVTEDEVVWSIAVYPHYGGVIITPVFFDSPFNGNNNTGDSRSYETTARNYNELVKEPHTKVGTGSVVSDTPYDKLMYSADLETYLDPLTVVCTISSPVANKGVPKPPLLIDTTIWLPVPGDISLTGIYVRDTYVQYTVVGQAEKWADRVKRVWV